MEVFPSQSLEELENKVLAPSWTVPLESNGPLVVCTQALLRLLQANSSFEADDVATRFLHGVFHESYAKLLDSDAVRTWKSNIISLIEEKMPLFAETLAYVVGASDHPELYNLVALALCDDAELYHRCGTGASSTSLQSSAFACRQYGLWPDVVNIFGHHGGFQRIAAYAAREDVPFENLLQLARISVQASPDLKDSVRDQVLAPIWARFNTKFDGMSNDDLKKLAPHVLGKRGLLATFAAFPRLRDSVSPGRPPVYDCMLRLLKCGSFSVTMSVMQFIHEQARYGPSTADVRSRQATLSQEDIAPWIVENDILDILLKGNLHQEQYVRRITKLVTILTSQKMLNQATLKQIWDAQGGKHETIVKNLHELLAEIAWDLTGDNLHYLFELFKESWGGSDENRRNLLTLMRRLAEEDTHNTMANQVLNLLWDLVHDDTASREIITAALEAHCHILLHGYNQEAERRHWINTLVEAIGAEKDVLLSVQQLHRILKYYSNSASSHTRHKELFTFIENSKLATHCQHALLQYYDMARSNPAAAGGVFSHEEILDIYLDNIRFFNETTSSYISLVLVEVIWDKIYCHAISETDARILLTWFAKICTYNGNDTDLDLGCIARFFDSRIVRQDPTRMNTDAFHLFWAAFKSTNQHHGKLMLSSDGLIIESIRDISFGGLDVLWMVALEHDDEQVAELGARALLQLFLASGSAVDFHNAWLEQIFTRLTQSYFEICRLEDESAKTRAQALVARAFRILTSYIGATERNYRRIFGLRGHRAAYRGQMLNLVLHRPRKEGRKPLDLLMHETDTMLSLRREAAAIFSLRLEATALQTYKTTAMYLTSNDMHTLGEAGVYHGQHFLVRSLNVNTNGPILGPANEMEEAKLPRMILANPQNPFTAKLYQIADEVRVAPEARSMAQTLLLNLPSNETIMQAVADEVVAKKDLALATLPELSRFRQLYQILALCALLQPWPDAERSPALRERSQTVQNVYRQSVPFAQLLSVCRISDAEAATPHLEEYEMIFELLKAVLFLLQISIEAASSLDKATLAHILSELSPLLELTASGRLGQNCSPTVEAKNAVLSVRVLNLMERLLAQEESEATTFLDVVFKHDLLSQILMHASDAGTRGSLVKLLMIVFPKASPQDRATLFAKACGLLDRVHSTPHCSHLFNLVVALVSKHEACANTDADKLFQQQIQALERFEVVDGAQLDDLQDELAGRFNLARALLPHVGSTTLDNVDRMLKPIVEKFLFPASKRLSELALADEGMDLDDERVQAICRVPGARTAAFSFLQSYLQARPKSLMQLLLDLATLHFSPSQRLSGFEYIPVTTDRSSAGFVGLKNAGATCYLNSSLQQLFMQPDIRRFLASELAIPAEDRNDLLLYQLQKTFVFLDKAEQQYYIPEDMWRTYRHWGEAVNVREQQDANEFLNCFVDQIDEQLKALQRPQILSRVLGGMFLDEKIIQKGCNHRYTRDEPFTTVCVEVTLSDRLEDGLAKYVQGEVLEGYKCEKCAEPRDTLKRQSIKRLPRVLAISLKRFDFDFERMAPTKFNKRYEFPMELDMGPYTAAGLHAAELRENGTDIETPACPYRLVGVIVHSGQANGGHYYSFIRQRDACGAVQEDSPWLRFEDTEVSIVEMDSPDTLHEEWFGGSYSSDVLDKATHRYVKRKRERWWNAYMLFYERIDPPALHMSDAYDHELDPTLPDHPLPPSDSEPEPYDTVTAEEKAEKEKELATVDLEPSTELHRELKRANVEFRHKANVFDPAYFSFLLQACKQQTQHFLDQLSAAADADAERAIRAAIQPEVVALVNRAFQFLSGFALRTDDSYRPALGDWPDVLARLTELSLEGLDQLLNSLTEEPDLFEDLLVLNTDAESRRVFARILINTCERVHECHGSEVLLSRIEDVLTRLGTLLDTEAIKRPRQFDAAFEFLERLSALGPFWCQELLARNFALRCFSPTSNTLPWLKQLMFDFNPLVLLLARLIRAGGPNLPEQTSAPPTNVRNPFILSSDVSPDAPNDEGVLSIIHEHMEPLMNMLVQLEEPYVAEAQSLLAFLCWRDDSRLMQVLCPLLLHLDSHSPWPKGEFILNSLKSMMAMPDNNLPLRLRLLHYNPKENNRVAGLFRILEFYLLVTCHDEGTGMNLTGWTKQSLCSFEMPVLFDYSTHHAKKVFYTGAFLAWELETIPEAREWLLAVPQVDKWATITSFIETSIASLPIVAGRNLDVDETHVLRRTESAENVVALLSQHAPADLYPMTISIAPTAQTQSPMSEDGSDVDQGGIDNLLTDIQA
ncbi:uncharacterized protein MONBRDRAFT_31374 [Monosiga brevicollis MX1]|uniref:ubiquitinyl hydrolase 1 n=1 Tax=Monosiga brevicollis TaxID=81824 RepID=A9URK5_MONBE|nr:uncharacterized protein MONBRDRAFT_31374 [Monosiga brevicollis MX1]EDQ92258.1 predicted protein [Monosiga brevicollis MX1]|eukprot:XP_001743544.1 hypothetical protein [Monosiga brevicollis MX1]